MKNEGTKKAIDFRNGISAKENPIAFQTREETRRSMMIRRGRLEKIKKKRRRLS